MAENESAKIITGSVIKAHGKFYWVQTDGYRLQCSVRETIRDKSETPLTPVVVGDKVDLETLIDLDAEEDLESRAPHGVIVRVYPRRTRFSRPKRGKEDLEQVVAANIDQMIIMSSVARPQFKPGLIDRFLVAAHAGGLQAVIVINKIDLEHSVDLERFMKLYNSIGVDVNLSSVESGEGIDEIKRILMDRLSIVLGQSGVGKSSLLNALEKGLNLKVGEISDYSQKGRHTTTWVEMYPLSFGGYVVDTPGLKYLGLWDMAPADLRFHFPEFLPLQENCKFRNCLHKNEPGCVVRKAADEGQIFTERYESYLKLLAQLEEEEPGY